MKFKKEQLDKLREILKKDYGISLDESNIEKLAISIINLTNISLLALTKENDNMSSSLVGAKTSQDFN